MYKPQQRGGNLSKESNNITRIRLFQKAHACNKQQLKDDLQKDSSIFH